MFTLSRLRSSARFSMSRIEFHWKVIGTEMVIPRYLGTNEMDLYSGRMSLLFRGNVSLRWSLRGLVSAE